MLLEYIDLILFCEPIYAHAYGLIYSRIGTITKYRSYVLTDQPYTVGRECYMIINIDEQHHTTYQYARLTYLGLNKLLPPFQNVVVLADSLCLLSA